MVIHKVVSNQKQTKMVSWLLCLQSPGGRAESWPSGCTAAAADSGYVFVFFFFLYVPAVQAFPGGAAQRAVMGLPLSLAPKWL